MSAQYVTTKQLKFHDKQTWDTSRSNRAINGKEGIQKDCLEEVMQRSKQLASRTAGRQNSRYKRVEA